jgi:serine/threonine protein kinase
MQAWFTGTYAANIMIDTEGDALIMDFGIARSTGDHQWSMPALTARDRLRGARLPRRSHHGGRDHGHRRYMAPERPGRPSTSARYATGLILATCCRRATDRAR